LTCILAASNISRYRVVRRTDRPTARLTDSGGEVETRSRSFGQCGLANNSSPRHHLAIKTPKRRATPLAVSRDRFVGIADVDRLRAGWVPRRQSLPGSGSSLVNAPSACAIHADLSRLVREKIDTA
jgi:hypothetical protein